MVTLPVIDVGPLLREGPRDEVVRQIETACTESGFFYITGHEIPAALTERLVTASHQFFNLSLPDKLEISMDRGGRAWRGFFPVGGELTSGRPDLKEGIYFGAELSTDDPRVQAGTPLHGPNLFPKQIPELRDAVLEYLNRMTALAQSVLGGIALSLGLPSNYFEEGSTADPTVLFRIFHYPPSSPDADEWGVGEHTDYGLLTLLMQDDKGGLEVRTRDGWVAAPPIPGTLVCNLGDMLDKLTAGYYLSTPHRVRNTSGQDRLSMPFFFDPGWNAELPPLPSHENPTDTHPRWDNQDLHAYNGTYGDYLLTKVSKVFPQLTTNTLERFGEEGGERLDQP